jgi:hypothetical protein
MREAAGDVSARLFHVGEVRRVVPKGRGHADQDDVGLSQSISFGDELDATARDPGLEQPFVDSGNGEDALRQLLDPLPIDVHRHNRKSCIGCSAGQREADIALADNAHRRRSGNDAAIQGRGALDFSTSGNEV